MTLQRIYVLSQENMENGDVMRTYAFHSLDAAKLEAADLDGCTILRWKKHRAPFNTNRMWQAYGGWSYVITEMKLKGVTP